MCPEKFTLQKDLYGVQSSSYMTLDGRRCVVYQQPQGPYPGNGSDRRLVARQAWKASWTQNCFMDLEMFDHLQTLSTLDQYFWLEYDDEMSRTQGLLTPVADNDYTSYASTKYYFTPTYPIAPYGYTPSVPTLYNGTITANGVILDPSVYTINSGSGLVRISNYNLTQATILRFSYSWRVFVRISEIELMPVGDLSQIAFAGTVVFSQVIPDYSKDIDNYNFNEMPITGVSLGNPSFGTVTPTISWGDTRYNTGVTGA